MPPKKITKKRTTKKSTTKKIKAEKIPVKNVSSKKKSVPKETIPKKNVEEVKPVPTKTKKNNNKNKVSAYRRIAGSFVFLTIILLVVIFYFTFIKLTIVIIPEQKEVSDSLTFSIYAGEEKDDSFGDYFPGIIEEVGVSQEKNYQASGTEVIGEEVVGKVIIKNNYTKNQPLVATTRLLDENNNIFRIKNTVNVPAGGEVEVEVYADEPSEEMAIGPSKFTIPGLWAGLQDKIFAVSDENFIYQQEVKKYIQQSDIDSGIKDMKDFLVSKVENSFIEDYKGYNKVLFKIDENSIETELTGKVGDEQADFNIKMNTNVVVIAFDENQVIEKAQDKLKLTLPDNYNISSFDKDKSKYEIQDYNVSQKIASIDFNFSGKTSLNEDNNIIDKQKIIGLTEEQLQDYLNNFDGIANFEIKFSPAFIKKVPNLVDRIEIKVE